MAETYYVKPDNSPVNDLTLNANDAMFIANGGTANGTVVNSDGAATVNDGGSANNTTVNEGGTLHLIGGAATGISVASDGRLEVNKGATATGIEAEKGATLVFDVAADTHIAGTSDGAAFQIQNGIATGFALETGVLIVSEGGKAVETVLNSAGFINVSQGGSADKAVINTSGELKVSSGGTATEATVKTGGKLTVESSGFCDDATIEMGGNLYVVSSGGTAAGTYIGTMGNLTVSKGGTAYGTTVGAGGFLTVGTKGIAEGADVNGFLNVLEGGLASNVTVNEGAVVYIQSKGTGSDVYVDDGGILEAMADGRLKGATVAQGGSATIHADVMASNVVIDGGKVTVMSDGWAYQSGVSSNTIVRNGGRLVVSGGGYVVGAAVSAGGHVTVESDATFSSATVVAADVTALDGACVSRLNLESGGILNVVSGGKAEHINVSAGGVLTGILREASELKFYGGTLDLNIAGVSPDSEALVDNISFTAIMPVAEDYLCTLTVSDTQAEGAYKLIEGASGFDTSKAITVKDTSGMTLGTLTVGGSTTIGGVNYTLSVTTEDVLAVTVAAGGGGVDLTGDLSTTFELKAGMVGSSVNILNGGKLNVLNDGFTSQTTVNSGGDLAVSAGGSADVVTVNFGGDLYVSNGATATLVKENGGYVYIDGGSTVTFVPNSFGGYSYINAGDWATIHSGTTGTDLTAGNGGGIEVFPVGTAVNTTIAAAGELWGYPGGKLTGKVTIETGANVKIYDGAIVDFDLTKTTAGDPALVNNLSFFGTAAVNYTLTVAGTEATGTYNLADGAAGFDQTITVVNTSGTTLGTLTVGGGTTTIGGVKYTLAVTTGNELTVTIGEVGNIITGDITGETKEVPAGWSAVNVNVNSKGILKVLNGGAASTTTVNQTGSMFVSNGGAASNTTVNQFGSMCVSNGGTASDTTVNQAGSMWVYYGGIASNTIINGADDLFSFMFVYDGGIASDTTVNSGGVFNVKSGCTADTTTLNDGGIMNVSNGGKANGVTVCGGDLAINDGGSATDIDWTPCEGYVSVDKGGYATFVGTYAGVYYGSDNKLLENAVVMDGKKLDSACGMCVMDGGKATNTTVDGCRSVFVWSGGSLSDTTIVNSGWITVSSGGFAGNTTITDGGLGLLYGASADAAKVGANGRLDVLSGASATNIAWTPCEGEVYLVKGGYATFASKYTGVYYGSNNKLLDSADVMDGITVDNGIMYVMDGGLATNTTADYGNIQVWSGGEAKNTTLVNEGILFVSSGGTATDITVNEYCTAEVSSGVIDGAAVKANGQLLIYDGARLTGRMSFETGAYVIPFVGSILDFDLTQTSPGSAALVNDLSILMGTPSYTLTVAGTEVSGTYNLADGAAGFDKTITVMSPLGEEYGTLTVGGSLSTAFADYTLNLSGGALTVNVVAKGGSDTTPPTITITPSTTELAKSVVMTAEFTDNVAVATQQYRIGDGAWLNYEAPFTVTENVLVSFRATDTSGNTTVESYEVQNIQPDEQNVPDNGWNDYLYDKKKGWNKDENISQFASNTITGNGEIHLDLPGTIALEDMHNMFGNDGINVDSGDVGKISVPVAAKMSFSVKSTADGTFYIYQDGFDKKGNRAQITVGKVSVKKGKVATLSGICLATDGEYYAAMTAKNVKKPGPSGIYNVTVVDSTIFVDADNGWNNAALNKAVVDNPFKVERGVKTVKLDNTDMIDGGDFNNFVGFSDPVDYAKLDLASTAYLSFDLGTNGSTKFTLWKRETSTGKFTKVGGVTSLKSKKGELVTKSTKAQLLEVSDKYDYFVSMECTDATKGGSAYYNVNVNTVSTRFFDSNDAGENNWLFDKKNKTYNDDANLRENTLSSFEDKYLYLDNTVSGDPAFNNFVGFKDSTDYAKVVLTKGGSLRFKITALADVTFEIWQKGEDKKGNPVLNSLQKKTVVKVKDYAVGNTETTDALTLEAGDYYISVTAKSTKSNEKGSAFYNVTALFASSEGDALVMPETSDSLAMTDSLSFGGYGADAPADVSAASALADLGGMASQQAFAALA